MYWLIFLGYFLCGIGLLGLLLFRPWGLAGPRKANASASVEASRRLSAPTPGRQETERPGVPAWAQRWIHYWPIVLLLIALTFPMLLVVHVQGDFEAANRPEDGSSGNAVAFAVLSGEQLVAPPPLPPAVFTTGEVEKLRPGTANANRDWSRLQPQFEQRLLRIMVRMQAEHGYQMVLLEGFRSEQRQARVAGGARTVTRAGPGQSYHQYGLAADCAFFRNGQLVISEKNAWALAGYRLFGEIAEEEGLTWGGRWKLRDYGHVEWRDSGHPDPVSAHG